MTWDWTWDMTVETKSSMVISFITTPTIGRSGRKEAGIGLPHVRN